MNDAVDTARRLLQQHAAELLSRRNVVATGVGYKMVQGERTTTPGIICSVEKKLPANALSASDLVPPQLSGIPTDVIETGRIRAWQAPTGRFRPAPGGVSVGHKDITASTLGCWARHNGEWMILSNNHVLANSNEAEILNIGAIQGIVSGNLGVAIKKMGRTTGLTEGEIQQVDVTVNVQYGGGRTALFKDQLMAGAMSQGGDSGSVVLDTQNQLLGLLFADSEQSTIINRIEHVFSALDLTL